jgi:choloylglycine hydrolase
MMKFILSAVVSLLMVIDSLGCTRVVYKAPNNTILTGRSMDFSIPIPANLWVFPDGIKRNGEVGSSSISWTSKYASVITSSWDIATTDGMNEEGLVANLLWLVQSEYPHFEKDGDTPGLSVSLWAQYALDNFSSVAEAVEVFRKEEFAVVTDFIPGTDKYTTVHLSLSDASGDNAILEYIDGKLVIHHDPSYTVMTNDPTFEEQLAIKKYWDQIPGKVFLPGTNNAADRFVRASFYINSVTQTDNTRVATAAVFSVIRNTSVPYGFSIEGFPNLSTTRWRVVADQKNKVYYFESALSPNVIWIDLNKLIARNLNTTHSLDLSKEQIYNGEVNENLKVTEPFKFQGLN